MELDLPFIWAGIIAFAVLMYVVLDGFDLGVGILFALEPAKHDRDIMMNTVAPVWDGNETWLVMGGGGLFAVFPLAYATVLPALYMPLIIMLLALVFRGVAFEYRWRTKRWKHVWNWAFILGSGVAAFTQGIALGALVQGISITNRAYSGGWWDWLTPFSILCGVAVVVGYMLLGATWLIYKLEGPLQERMRKRARWLFLATLGFIGVVSAITPFLDPVYFERWFALPAAFFSFIVPVLVVASAWIIHTGLRDKHDTSPFLGSLSLFVLSFAGIGISFYPHIVPPSLTIWQAAAPDSSLVFT
ncbi:MAG: cytochrome d ubiquinol oxidase subunit II, partial [Anderseniella sp.]